VENVSYVVKQISKRLGNDTKGTVLSDGVASAFRYRVSFFLGYYFGNDAIATFHILGPSVVIIMSGTVAFESLVLGEIASDKIGYMPNRAYQIQSGLANAATALTAVLVYVLDWGVYADATIVAAMLLFFAFSAANHMVTAIMGRNMRPVNLLRPAMALLLICFLLPPMIKALSQ
jgi:hypothetical protein